MCGTYVKHGKHACSQHTIKEAILKSIILEDIRELSRTLDQDNVLGKIKASADREKRSTEKHILDLEKQIIKLKDNKNALIKKLASGTISDEDYQEFVGGTNQEMQQLQVKVQQLKFSAQSNVQFNLERLKQKLHTFLKLDELTPGILHQLVEKVEVKSDGTPIIHYRFTSPV